MPTAPTWKPAPAPLVLERDEVHVWRVALEAPPERVQALLATLNDHERERAGRFYAQRHRERFIVARGALRAILARYLRLDPRALRFQYGPHGKPALALDGACSDVRFNLTHSHELALCAVARGRELGIDVEQIRPERAASGVAERFFSPREVAALHALPDALWTAAFFACWTRKEAYIKARSAGFGLPLDQFDVSVAPHEPAALLATRHDPPDVARWSLLDLEPGPSYAGALAVAGTGWRLHQWDWS